MDNNNNSHRDERYCPICNKRESRSECSYGGKVWDKVSIKDEEYSMVRSELQNIMKAAKRLDGIVGKGEGNLEAWVQSKITKASDYIDTAADYLESGEHKFSESTEEKIVDKILSEVKEDPCWKGYTQVGMKIKNGEEVPNCVPVGKGKKKVKKAKGYREESTTIEDLNGNTFVEIIDVVSNKPKIEEATRLPAQTGNILLVVLMWRGKSYTLRMFFPQVKLPTRKEVTDEIQKIYPGAVVLQHKVTNENNGEPLIQVSNTKSKNYLLNNKNIGEEVSESSIQPPAERLATDRNMFNIPKDERKAARQRLLAKTAAKRKEKGLNREEVEILEAKKSEMPCNKPKAEAHGSGETGKSHVVKACEGGKEKLIRFGQKGVKGSPRKKGESKEYRSRRERFKSRHAKNIAKGKMSAAYWADKVKW